MPKFFIIVLRYLRPLEEIESFRSAHRGFLKDYYNKGVFLASGAQEPRFGGIIMAKEENRKKLYKILEQDPFHQELCAEYRVIEFKPNNGTDSFKAFLNDAGIDLS